MQRRWLVYLGDNVRYYWRSVLISFAGFLVMLYGGIWIRAAVDSSALVVTYIVAVGATMATLGTYVKRRTDARLRHEGQAQAR